MSPTRQNSDEIKKLLIEKHLEYQLTLVNRRWQYFATYLIVNGLMFNVWKDIGVNDNVLRIFISIGSISMAVIFLQLTSLSAKRIEKSQIFLRKNNADIFDVRTNGKFYFGESVLLYIAFIASVISWFYLLYLTNIIAGIITSTLFFFQLFTLMWKPVKIIEKDSKKSN